MPSYTHKRGTTFSVASPLDLQVNGQRQLDFSGWQAHSQVRAPGGVLVATLAATITSSPAGPQITLTSPDHTASWPRGPVQIDVVFVTPAGERIASATAEFAVIDGPTRLP